MMALWQGDSLANEDSWELLAFYQLLLRASLSVKYPSTCLLLVSLFLLLLAELLIIAFLRDSSPSQAASSIFLSYPRSTFAS